MNIILDGVDCVGKDTQIRFIEEEFESRDKVVHLLHYSNIKMNSKEKILKASKLRYREMFKLFNKSDDLNIFIFNRAYLSEYVYSPIYRNYDGSYVFDYEKDFISKKYEPTKLIILMDEAEKIIKRDIRRGDGKTFSLDIDKKNKELNAFKEAYDKSLLDKKLVYLNGKTPIQLFNEDIKPFIFEDR